MALGGGTWLSQNKILPGTYINFSSIARATAALSDRGIVAAPLPLNWGPEGTVLEIENGDLQKNCRKLFGYSYEAAEMLPLRELFRHARKVFVYRLGTGAVKASCDYAEAKYGGTRGNDLKLLISVNVDDNTKFDVGTYLAGELVDTQTVAEAADLTNNDFVTFITTATLAASASFVSLSGGSNATVNGDAHSAFLAKIEAYAFHVLCCPASDSTTVALYAAFTRRMRDELGLKFQLVAWQAASDYEAVIGVWNTVTHASIVSVDSHALVYWVAGAQAAAAVNKSLSNTAYDGELTVNTEYTQTQLEDAILAGKFLLHNVSGTVRVLSDINTLVTLTDEKGAVFQSNQTMRVCDQIANDIAAIFAARYAGVVQNDDSGRDSLWGDVTVLLNELERIRAIEPFDPEEIVTIEQGNDKQSVLVNVQGLSIINAMEKLYMSVVVL